MLKLVIFLGVAFAAVWWFAKGRALSKKMRAKDETPAAPAAESAAPATIVACAHCGVHLPQSDALTNRAGQHFCGEPHRLAGKR